MECHGEVRGVHGALSWLKSPYARCLLLSLFQDTLASAPPRLPREYKGQEYLHVCTRISAHVYVYRAHA